jgi:hypothetical protein
MRQKVFPDLYSHERARVSGPPRFQRAAMIAAFHPPATFSVRFVRVLASPAGEKVHAAGEKRYLRGGWCLWGPDRSGPVPAGPA